MANTLKPGSIEPGFFLRVRRLERRACAQFVRLTEGIRWQAGRRGSSCAHAHESLHGRVVEKSSRSGGCGSTRAITSRPDRSAKPRR